MSTRFRLCVPLLVVLIHPLTALRVALKTLRFSRDPLTRLSEAPVPQPDAPKCCREPLRAAARLARGLQIVRVLPTYITSGWRMIKCFIGQPYFL